MGKEVGMKEVGVGAMGWTKSINGKKNLFLQP
jgi:hypothetical protein